VNQKKYCREKEFKVKMFSSSIEKCVKFCAIIALLNVFIDFYLRLAKLTFISYFHTIYYSFKAKYRAIISICKHQLSLQKLTNFYSQIISN
jgi:hypothetical protein